MSNVRSLLFLVLAMTHSCFVTTLSCIPVETSTGAGGQGGGGQGAGGQGGGGQDAAGQDAAADPELHPIGAPEWCARLRSSDQLSLSQVLPVLDQNALVLTGSWIGKVDMSPSPIGGRTSLGAGTRDAFAITLSIGTGKFDQFASIHEKNPLGPHADQAVVGAIWKNNTIILMGQNAGVALGVDGCSACEVPGTEPHFIARFDGSLQSVVSIDGFDLSGNLMVGFADHQDGFLTLVDTMQKFPFTRYIEAIPIAINPSPAPITNEKSNTGSSSTSEAFFEALSVQAVAGTAVLISGAYRTAFSGDFAELPEALPPSNPKQGFVLNVRRDMITHKFTAESPRIFRGTDDVDVRDVASDGSDLFVVGHLKQSISFENSPKSHGAGDGYIARCSLDSPSSCTWSKIYGSQKEADSADQIAIIKDELFVAGYASANATLDDEQVDAPTAGMFILPLSKDGKRNRPIKVFSGKNTVRVRSLDVIPDDNNGDALIVTGQIDANGSPSQALNLGCPDAIELLPGDLFVAKFFLPKP